MPPPSLILGPRSAALGDDASDSDLQQMLGKVLEVLRRRRWLFILPALTAALLVLAGSLFVQKEYTATVMFERRDDVVITGIVSGHTPYSFTTLRRAIEVELVGYDPVKRAASELGLFEDLPRDAEGQLLPDAVERQKRMLDELTSQISYKLAQSSDNLDTIRLSYVGPQPEVGERLIRRLKDNYVAMMRERIAGILNQAHAFFRKEAAQRQQRVSDIVWEQIQFSLDHPGVDPSDPNVLERKLLAEQMSLENVIGRERDTESKLSARLAYLEELDAAARDGVKPKRPVPLDVPAEVANPRRAELAARIAALEAEMAEVQAVRGMTSEHPTILTMRKKIDLQRAEYEATPAMIPNPARPVLPESDDGDALAAERRRVEMEIASLREVLEALSADAERHRSEISRMEEDKVLLPQRREHFLTMQQELSNAKTDLKVWNSNAEQLERVLVATTQDRGIHFATVSEARSSALPHYPTLTGIYLMCIGVGIGVGTAAVFLRELFDRSFRHPARVRQSLGIPVLETIGEIRVGGPRGLLDRHRLLPAAAVLETMVILALSLIVYIRLMEPVMYSRIWSQIGALLPV